MENKSIYTLFGGLRYYDNIVGNGYIWDGHTRVVSFSTNFLPTYNPETHDLVEKKDAKINRLKSEIEVLRLVNIEYEDKIKYYNKALAEQLKKLDDKKQELKQLEE